MNQREPELAVVEEVLRAADSSLRLRDFANTATMAMFWLMLVVFVCFSVGFGQELSCSTVKSAWRSKRLTESEVPPSAVDGKHLLVPYQQSSAS